MQGIRYAILPALVTAAIALWLHLYVGYPIYESITGGVLVGVFTCAAVARRREWIEEWRDFREK